MNAQDHELYRTLTQRHAELENSVALLKSELEYFRARLATSEITPPVPVLPPLPVPAEQIVAPAIPPPLPPAAEPVMVQCESPSLPTASPQQPVADKQPPLSLEFQFGRWLARIGVVFALITLVSFSALFYKYTGPWSKLGVLTAVSLGLVAGGFRLERKNPGMTVYARTLAGGGLACLYYTIYGATYVEQLHVIPSRAFGGLLLLAWSGWVLWLSEKRKSELLSIFAIALAYFSSAITPVGGFTMVANLILAATAVIFLVRNAWTGLSYLCLIGTYAGFLRQIVVNRGADPFAFDFLRVVSFEPLAVYLIGAWIIFTATIFFARTPAFAEGKRMAFLCLNNGAFAGLLIVAEELAHYGHVGGILGATGVTFLAAYALARQTRPMETDVAGAYLMQGLALATGGIAIAYSGVTRGLLITTESVFLAASGAYSRNLILRISAGVAALLGSFYLLAEIAFESIGYPWILTFGGAAAMLANAWLARREFWAEPRGSVRIVWPSAAYILLALALLAFGVNLHAADEWIPLELALLTLGLTFAVYFVPLFELAPLSQLLLVMAQVIAFIPRPTELFRLIQMPDWTRDGVALMTMVLVTWWPRQKLVRTEGWLQPFLAVYALAMAAFCYDAIQPNVGPQPWMVVTSLLSLAFLAYGIWARVWAFAIVGQIFLAVSLVDFLDIDVTGAMNFPWSWWAAAVPVLVVYGTGWLARSWLPTHLQADEMSKGWLRLLGRVYQSIAVGLTIRWIFGVVPEAEQTLAFFGVGTALLLVNTRWPSAFGARAAFVFDVIGAATYVLGAEFGAMGHAFTWPEAIGFAFLLGQPAILHRLGSSVVSQAEAWLLILGSSAISWLFVSNCVIAMESHNLTLAWALFAVILTGIGFVAEERRQRWCGLGILVAAMIRVVVYDFWQFSDLYKVLTFFVLTVICLGLSFLYYKFADKVKEWL